MMAEVTDPLAELTPLLDLEVFCLAGLLPPALSAFPASASSNLTQSELFSSPVVVFLGDEAVDMLVIVAQLTVLIVATTADSYLCVVTY
jgi:hypothetical protein